MKTIAAYSLEIMVFLFLAEEAPLAISQGPSEGKRCGLLPVEALKGL